MDHYIAYHSEEKMGYAYEAGDPVTFSTNKAAGMLRGALGNTAWIVASTGAGRRKRYLLAGFFSPSEVTEDESGREISGKAVHFDPMVDISSLAWFRELLREQANFSLGFGKIRSQQVIDELITLRDETLSEARAQQFPEEVGERTYLEGHAVRVPVNRYERDPAARAACLAALGSRCVICRVDLTLIYGPVARDLVHVHHLKPLSSVNGEYQVDPVTDLIPVCPSCHSVLHRENPPMSPEQLRAEIARAKAAG